MQKGNKLLQKGILLNADSGQIDRSQPVAVLGNCACVCQLINKRNMIKN